jgi:hypothetical protein
MDTFTNNIVTILWPPLGVISPFLGASAHGGIVGTENEKALYGSMLTASGYLAMEEEQDKGKKAKHPPFIVYQKKLYVLTKKEGAAPKEGEASAPVSVVKKPARRPVQAQRRAAGFRPRPYVKGVYRAYIDSAPHLVSMSRKRRKRTA